MSFDSISNNLHHRHSLSFQVKMDEETKESSNKKMDEESLKPDYS